jgi:hypothetical protein
MSDHRSFAQIEATLEFTDAWGIGSTLSFRGADV